MNELLIIGIIAAVWIYLKKNQGEPANPDPNYTFIVYDPEAELRDAAEIFSKFSSFVGVIGKQRGVEPAVIMAIIHTESTGRADVVTAGKSGDLCYGLMQACYVPAKEIGFKDSPEGLLNPIANIVIGTALFLKELTKYGSYLDACAAYNLGTVRTNAAGEYVNQRYVDLCTRRTTIFRKMYFQQDQKYFVNNPVAREIPLDTTELV